MLMQKTLCGERDRQRGRRSASTVCQHNVRGCDRVKPTSRAQRGEASGLTPAQPWTTDEEPNPVRSFRGNYNFINSVGIGRFAIIKLAEGHNIDLRSQNCHYSV
jgi:hypothetical protein